MKKKHSFTVGLSVLISLVSISAWAVPALINYQGKLTDAMGNSLNGTYSMTFRLYDLESGGSSIWDETQSVSVIDGIYSVQLGTANILAESYFIGDSLYLEVVVEGETLLPRQRLTSTAFAMKAAVAETLPEGAVATAMLADGVVDTQKVADNAVTAEKIADGTVTATDIQDGEVMTEILDDDGTGSGLDADLLDGYSESAFFLLNQNEIVTGLPAFKGGESGVSPPFTVDSTKLVTNLNADYLDGLNSTDFASSAHSHHSLDAADGSPADVIHINNAGWVGIGTTTPSDKFEIRATSPSLSLTADSNQVSWLKLYETSGGSSYGFVLQYDGLADKLYLQSAGFVGNQDVRMAWEKNGEIGIGTISPTERLHITNRTDGGRAFLKIQSSHAINWGEAGLRIQTPQNMWHMRMDDDSNNNIPEGSLGLRSQDTGVEVMVWKENGNVGIGTTNPAARLHVNGTARLEVLEIMGGADLSEQFDVLAIEANLKPEPGMVVSIDPERPGDLVVTTTCYDRRVAGVISGAGGVRPGMVMGQRGTEADGKYPVALTGRVYTWADASYGEIQPGDLLTTSDTPGHVMKVTDYSKAQGAIIGKAMGSLFKGRGLVLSLVSLQ